MPSENNRTIASAQRQSVLLSILDATFGFSLLVMMLAWFFDPVVLHWKTVDLSASWGLKRRYLCRWLS